SSRRRHTRSKRDWSSDVCSSDLNFSVTLGRGQESPVRRADEVLAAQPLQDWRTIAWSEGAKGWWRAKFLALRCWRVDGDGTRNEIGRAACREIASYMTTRRLSII